MKKIYMKKSVIALLLILVAGITHAQINNPVLWSFTAKKIADKTYELHMTATISGNWHLYAQDAGKGPEPTSFVFTPNPLVKLDGKIKEVGKLEKSFDKNFNSELKYYAGKVDFVQKVKVRSATATVVKGLVNYMVCNDRQCLPPKDVPFTINISGK